MTGPNPQSLDFDPIMPFIPQLTTPLRPRNWYVAHLLAALHHVLCMWNNSTDTMVQVNTCINPIEFTLQYYNVECNNGKLATVRYATAPPERA